MKIKMTSKRRVVEFNYGYKCDVCGAIIHSADNPEKYGWSMIWENGQWTHLCPANHDIDITEEPQ